VLWLPTISWLLEYIVAERWGWEVRAWVVCVILSACRCSFLVSWLEPIRSSMPLAFALTITSCGSSLISGSGCWEVTKHSCYFGRHYWIILRVKTYVKNTSVCYTVYYTKNEKEWMDGPLLDTKCNIGKRKEEERATMSLLLTGGSTAVSQQPTALLNTWIIHKHRYPTGTCRLGGCMCVFCF